MARHKATLRLFSEVLTLPEMANVMGAPSSGGHSKGDARGRAGKCWEESYWRLESESTSEWLEDHIEEIVSWLERKIGDFDRIRSHCKADLFCKLTTIEGQAGVVVRRDLMPRLAALGLSVVIDVYNGGSSEEMGAQDTPL